jgi:hypothetical protein
MAVVDCVFIRALTGYRVGRIGQKALASSILTIGSCPFADTAYHCLILNVMVAPNTASRFALFLFLPSRPCLQFISCSINSASMYDNLSAPLQPLFFYCHACIPCGYSFPAACRPDVTVYSIRRVGLDGGCRLPLAPSLIQGPRSRFRRPLTSARCHPLLTSAAPRTVHRCGKAFNPGRGPTRLYTSDLRSS